MMQESSPYKARAGSYTGGRNGTYWMNVVARRQDGKVLVANAAEVGKKHVDTVQAAIEPDLLYPLLRGKDVTRWATNPNMYILVVQDHQDQRSGIPEDVMKQTYPLTYRYLKQFEMTLAERADRKYYPPDSPFYTMRNVADYTFAPYKVVCREQASFFTVAVASQKDGKVMVPDHKVMFIPFEDELEAHFVCASLANSVAQFIVKSYVVETSTSTHVVDHVRAPRFNHKDKIHRELAALSEQAHQLAADGNKEAIASIEQRADELAAEMWGLTKAELKEIQTSLEDLA